MENIQNLLSEKEVREKFEKKDFDGSRRRNMEINQRF